MVPRARIWIMRAVHLSAIRSSTSREGHCASRTEGAEATFRTPLSKTIPVDAQAERNIPDGMYRLTTYVVDCRFEHPKVTLCQLYLLRRKRCPEGFSHKRAGLWYS